MSDRYTRAEAENGTMRVKTLSLRWPIAIAAVAVGVSTLTSLLVMGTFWDKKGLFIGVEGLDGFEMARTVAHERQLPKAVEYDLGSVN